MQNKEINQNSNSNSEAELENSIVNRGNHGSRFRALSELDLNTNIGEEDMGEDCQNQTAGVILERDNQNKENCPVENQGEDMEQEPCTPRNAVTLSTQHRPGPAT